MIKKQYYTIHLLHDKEHNVAGVNCSHRAVSLGRLLSHSSVRRGFMKRKELPKGLLLRPHQLIMLPVTQA